MSDTNKSGLTDFIYWKKPRGKNGSLTVPPERAKAILDFWRNSCKKTESNEKQDSISSKNHTEDEKNSKLENCKLEKEKTCKEIEKKEMSLSNKSTKLSLNKKNSVNKILKKDMESGEFSTEIPEVVSPERKSPKERKNLNNSSDKSQLLAENSNSSTEISKVGSKRKINHYFDVKPNKKICTDIEATCIEQSLSSHAVSFDISINNPIKWTKIIKQDLDLSYAILFSKSLADNIFKSLEKETEYYSGDLSKVRVFGKWHNIPRKQVAFGDDGLTYKFSGNCLPARPWTPLLSSIRDQIQKQTGFLYNFVLINRYKDGSDHIGEHRDNEKELIPDHPIASLSFGQQRDFVLRHALARTGATSGQHPPPVTVSLEHGSLLMMNSPTNKHWYHSLPVRKGAHNTRLNLTFRRMIIK